MFAERHSCNELISKSQSFINEHFMNVSVIFGKYLQFILKLCL